MSLEIPHTKPDIWVPGMELDVPLATPEVDSIRTSFADAINVSPESIVSLPDSLSALRIPEVPPAGYAFIDVDDVAGDLSGSLQMLQHGNPTPTSDRINNHDYGENLFFDDSDIQMKQALFALIRGSVAGLRPARDIDQIVEHMRDWRSRGIYTGFLSVLSPGSELPTVDNFIGRYFGDVADFIVITPGDYRKIDKGAAARAVVKRFGFNAQTPVVALDDWPRHIQKIRHTLSDLPDAPNTKTIQYVFPSHTEPDTASEHTDTVLDAFRSASTFFDKTLEK